VSETQRAAKREFRAAVDALMTMLMEVFPAAFTPTKDRPLKIGIGRDLRELLPEVPQKQLHIVLQRYTGSWPYLTSW
jgi:sRNA-binding protein